MTLIEPFDRDPLQNIAGCLSIKPDLLYLVGNGDCIERSANLYSRILRSKGLDKITVTSKKANAYTINDAVDFFVKIIKKHSPCVIDLFGGDELLITAAGIAYHTLKDEWEVSLQQVDVDLGQVISYDDDGTFVMGERISLTVKQSVALNGGVVTTEQSQPARNYAARDIEPIWNILKSDTTNWNKKVSALNLIESRGGCNGDELEVFMNVNTFKSTLPNEAEILALFDNLIKDLSRCGAIRLYQNNAGVYRYRYKNQLMRQCLKKAGNTLEHKVFFEVREFAKSGKPFFNDCLMSVMLDWDGVVHNITGGPDVRDTRNEIDVMAMRGAIPLFISCKNGDIEEEELYKLHTVAHKIGGPFAKKILVATDYEPKRETTKLSFERRAADMGIVFEPDAARLDAEGWRSLFERTFDEN